jgi:hypothetical protein
MMTSATTAGTRGHAGVLNADSFKHFVDGFNATDHETVVNLVPNAQAWDWMKRNVPLFDCPDPGLVEIYYYRWWTFRKHIKETPAGLVLTEFILPVSHAGTYQTISCATGHHLAEGRWLREQRLINDYTRFWFRSNGGKPERRFHKYSQWIASAMLDRAAVNGDQDPLLELLDDLVQDYILWEHEKLLPNGMYWQYDVRDGMEESISGSRTHRNPRPTINSYMYANSLAIAAIAERAGKPEIVATYRTKGAALKKLVQDWLWDKEAKFFKVMFEDGSLSSAREAIGFIPWVFRLPDAGYEDAWKQLTDPEGFWAPCGITTAERRHAGFRTHGVGHCEWDGAVWPFATSQTLDALANLLRHYDQPHVTKKHYLEAMLTYAKSQHKNGKPYVGEYLDEKTGEWLKGDNPRSEYYNHSTFCDLVIAGLVGIRPRADDTVEIHPLVPDDAWDWFCLDDVLYHGRCLTVVWDRLGTKYNRGAGLSVFAGGHRVAHAATLTRVTGALD